ncbi:hypothetical protein GGF49_005052 [Coemansia sp. RSA 1853]|nr:hypothetical protein LPJ76_005531 [Coemansia sp. RSA 638]KAJ2539651.1 hypothetical protein GGF49_005052 [Coemansia sp. RSA 1853]
MAKSLLKGADAFISRSRPVLRALAYAIISLMSLVNLAMLSSSWSNTKFMRNNGAFTGVLVVTSSIVTMVVSAVYAFSTTLIIRAHQDTAKLYKRLANTSIEHIVCCLMATWWLSVSFTMSNMAFVFRAEIKQCVERNIPARDLNPGVTTDSAATACTVFRGSLALCWMIWIMWVGRIWRVLTRSNMHFDSRIFQEADNVAIDLDAIKPVRAELVNPETFSPRYPNACKPGQVNHEFDSDTESQYTMNRQPVRNTRLSQYTDRPLAVNPMQHSVPNQNVMYKVCPPVVGTATLVTEPVNT